MVFQPAEIFVDDESKLTLHGLQQYYVKIEEGKKNRKLNDLLDALEFNQVVIFVSSSVHNRQREHSVTFVRLLPGFSCAVCSQCLRLVVRCRCFFFSSCVSVFVARRS